MCVTLLIGSSDLQKYHLQNDYILVPCEWDDKSYLNPLNHFVNVSFWSSLSEIVASWLDVFIISNLQIISVEKMKGQGHERSKYNQHIGEHSF